MNATDIKESKAARLALTREETAAALGVSASSVDRLTKRKLLRPSRAMGRPLFAVSEIERFLRETTADLGAVPQGGR